MKLNYLTCAPFKTKIQQLICLISITKDLSAAVRWRIPLENRQHLNEMLKNSSISIQPA